MAIRILIADDHRVVRQGLQLLLKIDPELDVVGEARDGAEAVRLASQLRPDVVLMDLVMPVMDGIAATRRLRAERPTAVILMLTGSSSPADVDAARLAGAAGYVTKDRIASELVDAIYAAAPPCE